MNLRNLLRQSPIRRWAKRVGISLDRNTGEVMVPPDISDTDARRALTYGEPAITVALTTGRTVTTQEYIDAGWFRNELNIWVHPAGDEEGLRLLSLPAAEYRAEAIRRTKRNAGELHAMTGQRPALSTADIVDPDVTTVGNTSTWTERKGQWARDVFARIR